MRARGGRRVHARTTPAAPHVGEADVAVLPAGPDPGRDLPRRRQRWCGRPRRAGADALHPGYGFLSENPALAEACARGRHHLGGPTAGGDARSWATRRGPRRRWPPPACRCSRAPWWVRRRPPTSSRPPAPVGYPLLVKASAGGGGRGMRLVEGPGDLADAVAVGAARGRGGLRLGRGVPRALPGRARATSRSRWSGTRHGNVRAPLRPRVLGAAPPPEGGRGGAGRARARGHPARACGTPPSPPPGPWATQGVGHRRVPCRRRATSSSSR